MIATTQTQRESLRAGGKILAGVLNDLILAAKEGITTAELDLVAEHKIRAQGATPSFLNYQPEGAQYPYPAVLCASVDDEVVHGLPSEKKKLRNGQILSLDLGLVYKGVYLDAARTMIVGDDTRLARGGERSLMAHGVGDLRAHELVEATEEAHQAAIAAARAGGHVGDIGAAVLRVARARKFVVVEDLGGHAVGGAVHERPFIPNEGVEGEGEELPLGLVLAIEPMLAEGKGAIMLDKDGWTYRMRDRKRAAHFEDTLILTEQGPEVVTRL